MSDLTNSFYNKKYLDIIFNLLDKIFYLYQSNITHLLSITFSKINILQIKNFFNLKKLVGINYECLEKNLNQISRINNTLI